MSLIKTMKKHIKNKEHAMRLQIMVERIISAYDMKGYSEADIRLSLLICTEILDEVYTRGG